MTHQRENAPPTRPGPATGRSLAGRASGQHPRRDDLRDSRRPPRRDDSADLAAGALPLLLSAVIALIGSLRLLPAQPGGIPLGFLLLIGVQSAGFVFAREMRSRHWRAFWLMLILITSVLAPTAALQTSIARAPFVSLSRGSAGIALWATVGLLVLLAGLFTVVVSMAGREPLFPVVLWLPVTLVLPALLAASGGTVEEYAALRALALAFFVAAIAVFLVAYSPAEWSLAIILVLFTMESGLLLVLGRGLNFPPTQGKIVPVLAAIVVAAGLAGQFLIEPAARWFNPPPSTAPDPPPVKRVGRR